MVVVVAPPSGGVGGMPLADVVAAGGVGGARASRDGTSVRGDGVGDTRMASDDAPGGGGGVRLPYRRCCCKRCAWRWSGACGGAAPLCTSPYHARARGAHMRAACC
jgi:hypothetical protein